MKNLFYNIIKVLFIICPILSVGQDDFTADIFNSINQENGRIEVQVINVGNENDQHAPPFTFSWESLEGNSMSIDNNIIDGKSILTELIPGTYCVTITNLDGFNGNECYEVENIDVIMLEYPDPLTIPMANNNLSAEISNLESGLVYSYQWQIHDLDGNLLIPLYSSYTTFEASPLVTLNNNIDFLEEYNIELLHKAEYQLALVFSEGPDVDLTDLAQVEYTQRTQVEANTAYIASDQWPTCLGPTSNYENFIIRMGGLPEGEYYYQFAANKDGNWNTQDFPSGTLNSSGVGTFFTSSEISSVEFGDPDAIGDGDFELFFFIRLDEEPITDLMNPPPNQWHVNNEMQVFYQSVDLTIYKLGESCDEWDIAGHNGINYENVPLGEEINLLTNEIYEFNLEMKSNMLDVLPVGWLDPNPDLLEDILIESSCCGTTPNNSNTFAKCSKLYPTLEEEVNYQFEMGTDFTEGCNSYFLVEDLSYDVNFIYQCDGFTIEDTEGDLYQDEDEQFSIIIPESYMPDNDEANTELTIRLNDKQGNIYTWNDGAVLLSSIENDIEEVDGVNVLSVSINFSEDFLDLVIDSEIEYLLEANLNEEVCNAGININFIDLFSCIKIKQVRRNKLSFFESFDLPIKIGNCLDENTSYDYQLYLDYDDQTPLKMFASNQSLNWAEVINNILTINFPDNLLEAFRINNNIESYNWPDIRNKFELRIEFYEDGTDNLISGLGPGHDQKYKTISPVRLEYEVYLPGENTPNSTLSGSKSLDVKSPKAGRFAFYRDNIVFKLVPSHPDVDITPYLKIHKWDSPLICDGDVDKNECDPLANKFTSNNNPEFPYLFVRSFQKPIPAKAKSPESTFSKNWKLKLSFANGGNGMPIEELLQYEYDLQMKLEYKKYDDMNNNGYYGHYDYCTRTDLPSYGYLNDQVLPGTVPGICRISDGNELFGAGFLVANQTDRYILTAAHVIDGVNNPNNLKFTFGRYRTSCHSEDNSASNGQEVSGGYTVKMMSGFNKSGGSKEKAKKDDWVLLQLNNPVNNTIIPLDINVALIANPTSCLALGFPNGDMLKYAYYGELDRRSTDRADNAKQNKLQTDSKKEDQRGNITGGFSGGPLLDQDGKAIGINTSSWGFYDLSTHPNHPENKRSAKFANLTNIWMDPAYIADGKTLIPNSNFNTLFELWNNQNCATVKQGPIFYLFSDDTAPLQQSSFQITEEQFKTMHGLTELSIPLGGVQWVSDGFVGDQGVHNPEYSYQINEDKIKKFTFYATGSGLSCFEIKHKLDNQVAFDGTCRLKVNEINTIKTHANANQISNTFSVYPNPKFGWYLKYLAPDNTIHYIELVTPIAAGGTTSITSAQISPDQLQTALSAGTNLEVAFRIIGMYDGSEYIAGESTAPLFIDDAISENGSNGDIATIRLGENKENNFSLNLDHLYSGNCKPYLETGQTYYIQAVLRNKFTHIPKEIVKINSINGNNTSPSTKGYPLNNPDNLNSIQLDLEIALPDPVDFKNLKNDYLVGEECEPGIPCKPGEGYELVIGIGPDQNLDLADFSPGIHPDIPSWSALPVDIKWLALTTSIYTLDEVEMAVDIHQPDGGGVNINEIGLTEQFQYQIVTNLYRNFDLNPLPTLTLERSDGVALEIDQPMCQPNNIPGPSNEIYSCSVFTYTNEIDEIISSIGDVDWIDDPKNNQNTTLRNVLTEEISNHLFLNDDDINTNFPACHLIGASSSDFEVEIHNLEEGEYFYEFHFKNMQGELIELMDGSFDYYGTDPYEISADLNVPLNQLNIDELGIGLGSIVFFVRKDFEPIEDGEPNGQISKEDLLEIYWNEVRLSIFEKQPNCTNFTLALNEAGEEYRNVPLGESILLGTHVEYQFVLNLKTNVLEDHLSEEWLNLNNGNYPFINSNICSNIEQQEVIPYNGRIFGAHSTNEVEAQVNFEYPTFTFVHCFEDLIQNTSTGIYEIEFISDCPGLSLQELNGAYHPSAPITFHGSIPEEYINNQVDYNLRLVSGSQSYVVVPSLGEDELIENANEGSYEFSLTYEGGLLEAFEGTDAATLIANEVGRLELVLFTDQNEQIDLCKVGMPIIIQDSECGVSILTVDDDNIISFFEPISIPVQLSSEIIDNLDIYAIKIYLEHKTSEGYPEDTPQDQLNYVQGEGLWDNPQNVSNSLNYYVPNNNGQITVDIPNGIYEEFLDNIPNPASFVWPDIRDVFQLEVRLFANGSSTPSCEAIKDIVTGAPIDIKLEFANPPGGVPSSPYASYTLDMDQNLPENLESQPIQFFQHEVKFSVVERPDVNFPMDQDPSYEWISPLGPLSSEDEFEYVYSIMPRLNSIPVSNTFKRKHILSLTLGHIEYEMKYNLNFKLSEDANIEDFNLNDFSRRAELTAAGNFSDLEQYVTGICIVAGRGTGFLAHDINGKKYVVTAAHVLGNTADSQNSVDPENISIEFGFHRDQKHSYTPIKNPQLTARLIAKGNFKQRDSEFSLNSQEMKLEDWAVLEFIDDLPINGNYYSFELNRESNLQVGERKMAAMGYGATDPLNFVFRKRLVTSDYENKLKLNVNETVPGGNLPADFPISHIIGGHSGSPLFNENGLVLGVLVSSNSEDYNPRFHPFRTSQAHAEYLAYDWHYPAYDANNVPLEIINANSNLPSIPTSLFEIFDGFEDPEYEDGPHVYLFYKENHDDIGIYTFNQGEKIIRTHLNLNENDIIPNAPSSRWAFLNGYGDYGDFDAVFKQGELPFHLFPFDSEERLKYILFKKGVGAQQPHSDFKVPVEFLPIKINGNNRILNITENYNFEIVDFETSISQDHWAEVISEGNTISWYVKLEDGLGNIQHEELLSNVPISFVSANLMDIEIPSIALSDWYNNDIQKFNLEYRIRGTHINYNGTNVSYLMGQIDGPEFLITDTEEYVISDDFIIEPLYTEEEATIRLGASSLNAFKVNLNRVLNADGTSYFIDGNQYYFNMSLESISNELNYDGNIKIVALNDDVIIPSEDGTNYYFTYSQGTTQYFEVSLEVDLPGDPSEFKLLDEEYGDHTYYLTAIFSETPIPLSQFNEENIPSNPKLHIPCDVKWLVTTNSIYANDGQNPPTGINLDVYDPINDGNRLNNLELVNGETYQLVTNLYTNTGQSPEVTLLYGDGTPVITTGNCDPLPNNSEVLSCSLFEFDDSKQYIATNLGELTWLIGGNTDTKAPVTEVIENFIYFEPCSDFEYEANSTFDCISNEGTVNIVSNNNAPFTVEWNDGSTAIPRNNMLSGTYRVTITDQEDCSFVEELVIGANMLIPYALSSNGTCLGASNGSIAISDVGPNVTVTWDDVNSNELIRTGLSSGEYYFSLSNPEGCSMHSITVHQYNFNPTLTGYPSCAGQQTGGVSVSVEGTPSFQWEEEGGVDLTNTESTLSNVGSGTYLVTVTSVFEGLDVYDSGNTCEIEDSYTVDIHDPLDYTINTTLPCHEELGTAEITFNGSVLWNDLSTAKIRTDLEVDNYSVTLTDFNGCQHIEPVEIHHQVNADVVALNPSCDLPSNGTAEVTNALPTWTYEWSGSNSTSSIAGGLSAGLHTVTVTDTDGCYGTKDVVIGSYPEITYTLTTTEAELGEENGTATIIPNESGVSIEWPDAGVVNGNTISELASGTYIAILINSTSCVLEVEFTITSPIINPTNPIVGGAVQMYIMDFGEENYVNPVTINLADIGDLEDGATYHLAFALINGNTNVPQEEIFISDANQFTFEYDDEQPELEFDLNLAYPISDEILNISDKYQPLSGNVYGEGYVLAVGLKEVPVILNDFQPNQIDNMMHALMPCDVRWFLMTHNFKESNGTVIAEGLSSGIEIASLDMNIGEEYIFELDAHTNIPDVDLVSLLYNGDTNGFPGFSTNPDDPPLMCPTEDDDGSYRIRVRCFPFDYRNQVDIFYTALAELDLNAIVNQNSVSQKSIVLTDVVIKNETDFNPVWTPICGDILLDDLSPGAGDLCEAISMEVEFTDFMVDQITHFQFNVRSLSTGNTVGDVLLLGTGNSRTIELTEAHVTSLFNGQTGNQILYLEVLHDFDEDGTFELGCNGINIPNLQETYFISNPPTTSVSYSNNGGTSTLYSNGNTTASVTITEGESINFGIQQGIDGDWSMASQDSPEFEFDNYPSGSYTLNLSIFHECHGIYHNFSWNITVDPTPIPMIEFISNPTNLDFGESAFFSFIVANDPANDYDTQIFEFTPSAHCTSSTPNINTYRFLTEGNVTVTAKAWNGQSQTWLEASYNLIIGAKPALGLSWNPNLSGLGNGNQVISFHVDIDPAFCTDCIAEVSVGDGSNYEVISCNYSSPDGDIEYGSQFIIDQSDNCDQESTSFNFDLVGSQLIGYDNLNVEVTRRNNGVESSNPNDSYFISTPIPEVVDEPEELMLGVLELWEELSCSASDVECFAGDYEVYLNGEDDVQVVFTFGMSGGTEPYTVMADYNGDGFYQTPILITQETDVFSAAHPFAEGDDQEVGFKLTDSDGITVAVRGFVSVIDDFDSGGGNDNSNCFLEIANCPVSITQAELLAGDLTIELSAPGCDDVFDQTFTLDLSPSSEFPMADLDWSEIDGYEFTEEDFDGDGTYTITITSEENPDLTTTCQIELTGNGQDDWLLSNATLVGPGTFSVHDGWGSYHVGNISDGLNYNYCYRLLRPLPDNEESDFEDTPMDVKDDRFQPEADWVANLSPGFNPGNDYIVQVCITNNSCVYPALDNYAQFQSNECVKILSKNVIVTEEEAQQPDPSLEVFFWNQENVYPTDFTFGQPISPKIGIRIRTDEDMDVERFKLTWTWEAQNPCSSNYCTPEVVEEFVDVIEYKPYEGTPGSYLEIEAISNFIIRGYAHNSFDNLGPAGNLNVMVEAMGPGPDGEEIPLLDHETSTDLYLYTKFAFLVEGVCNEDSDLAECGWPNLQEGEIPLDARDAFRTSVWEEADEIFITEGGNWIFSSGGNIFGNGYNFNAHYAFNQPTGTNRFISFRRNHDNSGGNSKIDIAEDENTVVLNASRGKVFFDVIPNLEVLSEYCCTKIEDWRFLVKVRNVTTGEDVYASWHHTLYNTDWEQSICCFQNGYDCCEFETQIMPACYVQRYTNDFPAYQSDYYGSVDYYLYDRGCLESGTDYDGVNGCETCWLRDDSHEDYIEYYHIFPQNVPRPHYVFRWRGETNMWGTPQSFIDELADKNMNINQEYCLIYELWTKKDLDEDQVDYYSPWTWTGKIVQTKKLIFVDGTLNTGAPYIIPPYEEEFIPATLGDIEVDAGCEVEFSVDVIRPPVDECNESTHSFDPNDYTVYWEPAENLLEAQGTTVQYSPNYLATAGEEIPVPTARLWSNQLGEFVDEVSSDQIFENPLYEISNIMFYPEDSDVCSGNLGFHLVDNSQNTIANPGDWNVDLNITYRLDLGLTQSSLLQWVESSFSDEGTDAYLEIGIVNPTDVPMSVTLCVDIASQESPTCERSLCFDFIIFPTNQEISMVYPEWICAGEDIVIDFPNVGNYEWNLILPEGLSEEGNNVSGSFEGPGEVSVVVESDEAMYDPVTIFLEATNNGTFCEAGGCFVPTTIAIELYPKRPVDIYTSSLLVCSGQNIVLGMVGDYWWTYIDQEIEVVGPTSGILDIVTPIVPETVILNVTNTGTQTKSITFYVTGGCNGYGNETITIDIEPEEAELQAVNIDACAGSSIPLYEIVYDHFEGFVIPNYAYINLPTGEVLTSQDQINEYVTTIDGTPHFSPPLSPFGTYQIAFDVFENFNSCPVRFVISFEVSETFELDWDPICEIACMNSVHAIGPFTPPIVSNPYWNPFIGYSINDGQIYEYPSLCYDPFEWGYDITLCPFLNDAGLNSGDIITIYFEYSCLNNSSTGELKSSSFYCCTDLTEVAKFILVTDKELTASDDTQICQGEVLDLYAFFNTMCLDEDVNPDDQYWNWSVLDPEGVTYQYVNGDIHQFDIVGDYIITGEASYWSDELGQVITWGPLSHIVTVYEAQMEVSAIPEYICPYETYQLELSGADYYSWEISAGELITMDPEGSTDVDYPFIDLELEISPNAPTQTIGIEITSITSRGCIDVQKIEIPVMGSDVESSFSFDQESYCSDEFVLSTMTGTHWQITLGSNIELISGDMEGTIPSPEFSVLQVHQFENTSSQTSSVLYEIFNGCAGTATYKSIQILPTVAYDYPIIYRDYCIDDFDVNLFTVIEEEITLPSELELTFHSVQLPDGTWLDKIAAIDQGFYVENGQYLGDFSSEKEGLYKIIVELNVEGCPRNIEIRFNTGMEEVSPEIIWDFCHGEFGKVAMVPSLTFDMFFSSVYIPPGIQALNSPVPGEDVSEIWSGRYLNTTEDVLYVTVGMGGTDEYGCIHKYFIALPVYPDLNNITQDELAIYTEQEINLDLPNFISSFSYEVTYYSSFLTLEGFDMGSGINGESIPLIAHNSTIGDGFIHFYITDVDPEACNFEFTKKVRVKPLVDDQFKIPLNTISGKKSTVKVYPNPFEERINLEFDSDSDQILNVELIDVTGKLVFNKKYHIEVGENRLYIDTKELVSGIYVIRYYSDNKLIYGGQNLISINQN